MREPFGGRWGITDTVDAHEDDERELIARPRPARRRPLSSSPGGTRCRSGDARWRLARMATGPKILRKRRWSRRGGRWRVSTAAADSRRGCTAFCGTGSERPAKPERRRAFRIRCSRPRAMHGVLARSLGGDVGRCPAGSPSGGELAGRASPGGGTPFLRGRDVGRDCGGS